MAQADPPWDPLAPYHPLGLTACAAARPRRRRVSEDYWPFNVDITTEDTAYGNLQDTGMHVSIGGTGSWAGGGSGGVAYVGVFGVSSPAAPARGRHCARRLFGDQACPQSTGARLA